MDEEDLLLFLARCGAIDLLAPFPPPIPPRNPRRLLANKDKMDEEKSAIEAAIARIEAPQAEGQSLKSAVNAMGTRVGGKVIPKTCGGAGACKILICDHKYATSKSRDVVAPMDEDPRLSPKLIESLLQKCKGDGYPITDYYLRGMYQHAGFSVLGAIKAIKNDIDRRERILHESGRVNVARENAMRGTELDLDAGSPPPSLSPASAPTQTCCHDVSSPCEHTLAAAAAEAGASAAPAPEVRVISLPYYRDTFLVLLEHEDALIRDATASCTNASPAANSFAGTTAKRTLMSRFQSREDKERGLQAYVEEGKWRIARAEYWKQSKAQRLSEAELETRMQVWEEENGGYMELMGGGWRKHSSEKVLGDVTEEDGLKAEHTIEEVGESSGAPAPSPYQWGDDLSLEDPAADAKWEGLGRRAKVPVKNSTKDPLPNPMRVDLIHAYLLANGGPEELVRQKQEACDFVKADIAGRRIVWKEDREVASRADEEAEFTKLANLAADIESLGLDLGPTRRSSPTWPELLAEMGDPENPDHAELMKIEGVFPKPKHARGVWQSGSSTNLNPDMVRAPPKGEEARELPPKTYMEYEKQAGAEFFKLTTPACTLAGIKYVHEQDKPVLTSGSASGTGPVDTAAQFAADELALKSAFKVKQGIAADVRKARKANPEDQRAAASRKSARDQYLKESLYTQDFTLESIDSDSLTEQQKISRLRILAGKLAAEHRELKMKNVELKARILQKLLSTAEVKIVGEPAYIMRTAARIADLNLTFEFTDENGVAKLGCDKMYYLIEDLNHKLDSFTHKILDESTRKSALEAWKSAMGSLSLKKMCEEAILINNLLMVEDLEQMADWTYASAGILDGMIVFYSRACCDPHEIQHRLASKKFQADMKEFLLLCHKVAELPDDLSPAGVAKAKDEFGSQDEENMEEYFVHRIRDITKCHCPEDVLDPENAALYDELLEMARDFDSVVFPYVAAPEDPFDAFKRVVNILYSGNSIPKTQDQIEEVRALLASQNVPTKLALLGLMDEHLDGVADDNSQMRALARASLRKDFELLFKYYLVNRPDIAQGSGVVFLEGVTGIRYQDLSTGQALRSVQQLDGAKIWEWLLVFQFARSRIETEWEEAMGAENLALPKGWKEELAEIKKQIADTAPSDQSLTGEQCLGKLIGIDPIKGKPDDKKALKETMKNLGLETTAGAPPTDVPAHYATMEDVVEYGGEEKRVLAELEAGEAAPGLEEAPLMSERARGKLPAISEEESTEPFKKKKKMPRKKAAAGASKGRR
ncbi:unnamed protein product [Diplocarpon coronariae]